MKIIFIFLQICILYISKIESENLCLTTTTTNEEVLFFAKKHTNAKFRWFCKKKSGRIYNPTDRTEILSLGIADLGPGDEIWTTAAPNKIKQSARINSYYHFANGRGNRVIQPADNLPIEKEERKNCMTYKLGDSLGEYIPRSCKKKAKGLCVADVTRIPQYFHLLWDPPVNNMDLHLDNGDCAIEYNPYTCDTGDGGQFCKSGDTEHPTSAEGEKYYLEPGSTSGLALLYAEFWGFDVGVDGNVRLEVHHKDQLIQTLYANNTDLFSFWIIGCVDLSIGVQSLTVINSFQTYEGSFPTTFDYC